MFSSQELGSTAPRNYEGSYRLVADMSWTSVDEISKVDEGDVLLEGLIKLD